MEGTKTNTVILDVAQCSFVAVWKHFGGTLVNLNEITQRHIQGSTVKADA